MDLHFKYTYDRFASALTPSMWNCETLMAYFQAGVAAYFSTQVVNL